MHPLGGWQSVAIRACSLPHLQPQRRRNWLSSMEPTLGTRWRPHSDNLLTPAWRNPPMRAQPASWSIASCQKRVLLTGAPVSAVLCSCVHTEGKYKSTVWKWWGVNVGSKESVYLWYFDIIDTPYFSLINVIQISFLNRSLLLAIPLQLLQISPLPLMWGCQRLWCATVKYSATPDSKVYVRV